MEGIVTLAAVAVAGGIASLVLKKQTPELALLRAMATGCLILFQTAGQAREISAFWTQMQEQTALSGEYFLPLLKIVGISLVVETASSFCKDAGEGGVASFLRIAGCLAALCAALPLMQGLMTSLNGLL